MDQVAHDLRAASRQWRVAKAAGTAREPDRPRVTLPTGRVMIVDDLTMSIVDAMEFLESAGFSITDVIFDYNENRVTWTNPDGRFIEVGLSSGPIVMIGFTKDGRVPDWNEGAHRHARDVVPNHVAQTLPDMEIAAGSTDITQALPACAQWARAALEAMV